MSASACVHTLSAFLAFQTTIPWHSLPAKFPGCTCSGLLLGHNVFTAEYCPKYPSTKYLVKTSFVFGILARNIKMILHLKHERGKTAPRRKKIRNEQTTVWYVSYLWEPPWELNTEPACGMCWEFSITRFTQDWPGYISKHYSYWEKIHSFLFSLRGLPKIPC